MHLRARSMGIAMVTAGLITVLLTGCGDDDNLAPVPRPVPTATPKTVGVGETDPVALIVSMAQAVLEDVAASQIQSLFFPNAMIDYQTLMDDFLNAVQLELDQQTITEQDGDVNGEMMNLNESNTQFTSTSPSDTTGINDVYNQVIAEEAMVNETLGVLEQQGIQQQSLAGWMSGAQVKLGFLALEIQLNAIRDPGNLSVQTELASDFQTFITYAETTRDQVLYSNIQTAIGKITSCHDVSCGGSAPSCNGPYADYTTYKDCNGSSHYWGDSNSHAECASARATNIAACGPQVFTQQNQNISWIEQVVNDWRSTLAGMSNQIAAVSKPCALCAETQSYLTVDQATISITGDLPADTPQDATVWFQAACNGMQTCDYKLAHADYSESGPFTLVNVSYHCGSDPTPHVIDITGSGNPLLSEGAYIHLDCAQRIANMQVTFRGQPVALSTGPGSEIDVSTHSSLGPQDAGKIDDGVIATNGTAYNDPLAIVLRPYADPSSALTIDMQSVVQLCGGTNAVLCGAPEIDADHNDVYHLDYSTDGKTWTSWVDFPTVSAGGLQFRVAPTSPDVTARYVRVYPTAGDSKYSVAELILPSVNTGYKNRPAYGPEPLITNGQYAPAGTAYNDSQYATVLADTGTANAQLIDFGEVHDVSHVKVQADQNDVYQLDVSIDNANWVPWYTVPTVSGGGLQTRDSGTLPPTLARYVRVYAASGDGKYSVSEVQIFANPTMPSCNGLPNCAVSAGEFVLTQTGAPPTAQDVQDLTATWTCGSNTMPQTTHAVAWNGDALMPLICLPSQFVCNPSQVTTCSAFAPTVMENGNSAPQQRSDDVVYETVAQFPDQICPSQQYPQCSAVIAGKTNYYHTNSSSLGTHDDPACLNVQRSIQDAVNEGSCPAGLSPGPNANVWPYNLPLVGGQPSGCLPNPVTQPAFLPFVGCGPYVD